MKQNVNTALDNVDAAYGDLIEIANSIIEEVCGDIDRMTQSAYHNIENLTNEDIRDMLLKLSLRSYSFSEIKEKSAFKAALAETLRKEAYANNFNSTEGSVAVRDNTAVVNTSSEIIAEEIYTLTASLFKTKLDELHRVVDTLKTVLMSRMQEAKLSSIDA